jgi:RNA polymerase sigma-70 factor (ECF subfamily)
LNELATLHRAEWGRLLSALIRAVGDFDVAEDALQDAFAAAVVEWPSSYPQHPRAWLYATARHKAIDRVRRRTRFADRQAELSWLAEAEIDARGAEHEESTVPDERLKLIFTCCHPALASDAQVALTLRTLCGLSTEEIAHAFLLPVPTLAQRLVRAKAKIRAAGIPYRVPEPIDLVERLGAVMSVLYLVFNAGYASPLGAVLVRAELCAEAIRLMRLLRVLLPPALCTPALPELDALLALMLLHDARSAARQDVDGELVLLADQDRKRWNHGQIAEGCALLEASLRAALPGTYALEAAIAALHAQAASSAQTDWPQIVLLYDRLQALHDTPVVQLNRAVAVAMARGPAAALPLVNELREALAGYHLWHATRADLLRQLGQLSAAAIDYRRAYALTQNASERRFLAKRLAEVAEPHSSE